MIYDVLIATAETIYMVLISTIGAIILGIPLGTLMFSSDKIKPQHSLHRAISILINILRSIPFIILLVALIPLTRLIVGSSIGLHAAIVPLTIGATPFIARLIANIYQELPTGLIETASAMGATSLQTIRYILIPEAMPALINAITLTAITLINYSAMAGTVGGGGLGDLAIRYGYQRFDISIMLSTVGILILLVQLLQWSGDRLARYFSHN